MTIEDTLCRLLDEAAPEPPADSAPPTDLPTVEPRRSWVLPLIAAAVVVALVGVLLVARAVRRDRGGDMAATRPAVPTSAAPTSTRTTRTTPTSPAGRRIVSYYGISIEVPERWFVGPVLCSPLIPRIDAVVVNTGEYAACPMQRRTDPRPRPQQYTTVELGPSPGMSLSKERDITVDGVPAKAGLDGDGHAAVIVPSRGVVMSVVAATPAARQAVLSTLHITSVDPLGCVDRAAPLVHDSNPAATDLLPRGPVSAVVCEYSGDENDSYRLLGSVRLTEVQLHSLVTRVDGSEVTSTFRGFQPVLARYVVTYSDGSTRTVDARLDEDPAPVTDGRRTVAVVAGNSLPTAFA